MHFYIIFFQFVLFQYVRDFFGGGGGQGTVALSSSVRLRVVDKVGEWVGGEGAVLESVQLSIQTSQKMLELCSVSCSFFFNL